MRKFLALILLIGLLPCSAFAISADDFIPPVQAKPEQQAELLAVKDEGSVKTFQDENLGVQVTQAATLQDAINKIIAKPKQGCEIVYASQSSGATLVATGIGTYKTDYENVIATRIEQRQAYVQAFMQAKAQMAQTTGELVIRGKTNFDTRDEILTSEKKTLINLDQELSESQQASVRKVLKGYVTYAVQDDETKGIVSVTIVSSPKTRGANSRNSTDGIVAANLNAGLNSLLAEIQNNLVPPVGGRIIEVAGTGETAWVGFGSAVVHKDSQASIQARLNLQAERIAGVRALDALAGIILGDDTKWTAHADESSRSQILDFERAQQSDQTTKGTAEEIKAYDTRKAEMRNTLFSSEQIESLRNGTLPRGVRRIVFTDENEYFAYGIAVYVPSVTDLVNEAAREMEEAQIVRPTKPRDPKGGAPINNRPANGSNSNSKLKLKKGPSGVVNQNI